jgi:hypothetical protein
MDKDKLFNWILYVSLFLLVLMTLVDMALVGEHQQFYKWIRFDKERDFVSSNYGNYVNSMNGILVIGTLFLLYLPFFVYSAY